jgi:hypothetical protein
MTDIWDAIVVVLTGPMKLESISTGKVERKRRGLVKLQKFTRELATKLSKKIKQGSSELTLMEN